LHGGLEEGALVLVAGVDRTLGHPHGGGDGLHGGQLEALFEELFQRAVEQLFVPLLGPFAGRAASARPSLASQMLHELF
jgi:hypothetical protein